MGIQYTKKKIAAKTEFIFLSDVVDEAKEKFDGWNLLVQLRLYQSLQTKIYRQKRDENIKNKTAVKLKLALLLINAIDDAYSKEGKN